MFGDHATSVPPGAANEGHAQRSHEFA
jgi:hypothetical protein